jgi:hypothetical protein
LPSLEAQGAGQQTKPRKQKRGMRAGIAHCDGQRRKQNRSQEKEDEPAVYTG